MKKVIIRDFKIYTPIRGDQNCENDSFDIDNFPHFPILLEDDGLIWEYGTLYLLSKLKSYKKPSSKTLDSIAIDLKDFNK
jgi:hypothetical protein